MSGNPNNDWGQGGSGDPFRRPTFGGGNRPTGTGPKLGDMMTWAWTHAAAAGRNAASSASNNQYSKAIRIDGSADFVKHVRAELDYIAKTATGTKLLGSDSTATGQNWRGKFQVNISKGKTCRAEPVHLMDGWKKGSYIMYDHLGLPVTYGNKGSGLGCGTKIEYNPAQSLPSELWFDNMPTALSLAHELIHAYLYARGEADPEIKDGIRNHELQVVGLSPFENDDITENKIRAEWTPAQPKRTKYRT